MDQNQTVDNDLQKAIDDITNTTNVDPVFSDPVAAPSSVPEGDTGELGEPVGPFPAPEPKVEAVMPSPEPIAPLQSMDIPELTMPELNPAPAPMPVPESIMPPNMPELTPEPAPEPSSEPTPEPIPELQSTKEIKTAALRDLVPLLDKIDADPSERFRLYCDIFEELKDYTVLEPAYRVAREIPDEAERANALLYVVKAIDKM